MALAPAVDPVDALAAVAVVQQRVLGSDAPAREAPEAGLPSARPYEGPGSPGFDRRLSARVDSLLAAFDDSGVPVVFDAAASAARLEYRTRTPERAATGAYGAVSLDGAAPSVPEARLVVPHDYAASPAIANNRASVAVAARDGVPVVDMRRVDERQLHQLFGAMAEGLPLVVPADAYAGSLGKAREAVYGHANRAGRAADDEHRVSGYLYAREAEHFASRMDARVHEREVEPPGVWEPPAEVPAAPGQLDGLCAQMAGVSAAVVDAVAADVRADAARALETRERACDRMEEVVLPALREAGLNVEVDPAATSSRYVPDPRPVREQRGPARDSVVVSARALAVGESTPQLVAAQGQAFQAVAIAAGQRGRLDQPDARAVASAMAGRRRCSDDVAERSVAAAHGYARQQLKDLWPAQGSVLPPALARSSEKDVKRASNAVHKLVSRAVAERDRRLDEAVAGIAAESKPGRPVSVHAMPPVPIAARPPAPAAPARSAVSTEVVAR